jgi:hypothetical protein
MPAAGTPPAMIDSTDERAMEINIPAVHAEITDAFCRYTRALIENDIDTVTTLFWHSTHTLRYGTGENLYGIEAIAAFRNSQRGRPLELDVRRVAITSFGYDFGTANCEMLRPDIAGIGRMSHTWVRLAEGWRIVAAHVSNIPAT